MKKLTAFLVFLICLKIFIFGQTASQLKLLGDEAFSTSNYHTAVVFYEAFLETEAGNTDVIFSLAESYRHLFNYSSARSAYLKVWNTAPHAFPQSGFLAAMMLKSEEKYPEAVELFRRYLEHGPVQNILFSEERALYEIAACDSAMKLLAKPLEISIRNFHEANTPWSEFNPVPVGDSVFFFSALRPLLETDNPLLATGDYRAQIYQASYGTAGLRTPEPLGSNVNGKDVHSANITISNDGTRAYFNRCAYSNYKLRCDVWMSEYRNNKWSKARKLSAPLNAEQYSTTQPFVTTDSVSGYDLLYFSSDRPGGLGGLDLWFCIIKDGQPQQPVNLGSIINTPGDEITPFYHQSTGTLYFSSDWHYGLGGFDVFRSKGAMSSWKPPINAGSPVNTGANDFFFYIGNDNESFLTSNRSGSMTFREATCCNDIYLVKRFPDEIPEIAEIPDTVDPSIKEDIMELLPLSLYFDNDQPDPRTTATHTILSYDQTLRNYLQQRQKFIEEYSAGLDGYEKYYATAEMEDFFENYVEASFKKLEILADFLYQDLKTGSHVTLKVRGFTSPLTSAEYNIALAKRRISSLINYFRLWRNGLLEPYLDFTSENGASLKIIEEPSGEALANPFVSDNPQDRRRSVYSKSASLERRIEILIYESDFKKYVNIDENIPVIYIPDNLILLSNFTGNNDMETDVILKNPGKVRLILKKIEASSPVIEIINQPGYIEPGETATIKVRIRGTLKAPFTEHIIIHSDSQEERNVVYFTTSVQSR